MPPLRGKRTLSALSLCGLSVSRPTSHHGLCPEIVVYALAYDTLGHGQADVEIVLLLLFEWFFKLGELLQLKVGDVVFFDFLSRRSHYETMKITIRKR